MHSIDELNESIAGLDDEDTGGNDGAQDDAQDEYQAEPIARQGQAASERERDLLLLRLNEATGKDFKAHDTVELRSIWKALCEDQEVSEELEIQHPTVRQKNSDRITG